MNKNTEQATIRQKEAMITAIEACYGNIRLAAKVAKISVRTHYRWLKEDNSYDTEICRVKDISFRNLKESVIDLAMKKAEKGDSAVINQMMRIFLKDLPIEMAKLNRYNDVPLRAVIRYVDTPQDPKRWEEKKTE